MWHQVRVRIEGDKTGVSDLGTLHIPEHLPREVLIGKTAILEADHLPGNLSPAITRKIKLDPA
jgi:hypothetical protein